MNKPKVGDKLYHVDCIDYEIRIEEKEVLEQYNNRCCLEDDVEVEYMPNMSAFKQIFPIPRLRNEFYYRTREQAIQKAIEEVKDYIKSFEGSIEEHKQILKVLENEISKNK